MQQSFLATIATVSLFSAGSLTVFAGSFLLTKASSNTAKTQIVTDTSRYQEIRNHKWADLDKIKHFPVEIPVDAKIVHMAYSPESVQGSSFLQVRLKEPSEKIQKLLSQYSKSAVREYRGGDTNEHSNKPNGLPTTFFYTGDSATEAFPQTYQIFVLKAQNQGQPGFKWNHGNSYGVAIDSSASEIVYWVEKW
ncbi:hypothetical protein [Anabaena sp. PCC 7108]|uniref:hypothetical protein n=1 Tax=Anabaena sp. PCC 7108 TaxID=163908 RepID=UPI0003458946|nr:hypothetical protein [Anabaena sp. PCC 7108]